MRTMSRKNEGRGNKKTSRKGRNEGKKARKKTNWLKKLFQYRTIIQGEVERGKKKEEKRRSSIGFEKKGGGGESF